MTGVFLVLLALVLVLGHPLLLRRAGYSRIGSTVDRCLPVVLRGCFWLVMAFSPGPFDDEEPGALPVEDAARLPL